MDPGLGYLICIVVLFVIAWLIISGFPGSTWGGD